MTRTSIKVKFRLPTVSGKEGSLYYQVIHRRAVRQINTKYKIHISEWNSRAETIRLPSYNNERNNILQSIQEHIRWDKVLLNKIVVSLNSKGLEYTADEVVRLFHEKANEQSFFHFMQGIIVQLKRLGKVRTSETYATTLRSFTRFRNGKDMMMDEIDSDIMMEYEAFLRRNGAAPNTVSFYMRILRAVYNRAVEKNLAEQRHPFRHVHTGTEKTIKRAIRFEDIKRIKDLQLPHHSALEFARDMFLFCFYTRGMSFIDMAFLRKTDLKDGVLSYRRRKTGQQLFIKWEKCMQGITDKHPPYLASLNLLPIVKPNKTDERTQYKNALMKVNKNLKRIAEMVGLSIPLTMYVARHSWASIAKSRNVPISVISESMGHESETTTQIYLASLDCSVIDRANAIVLKGL